MPRRAAASVALTGSERQSKEALVWQWRSRNATGSADPRGSSAVLSAPRGVDPAGSADHRGSAGATSDRREVGAPEEPLGSADSCPYTIEIRSAEPATS